MYSFCILYAKRIFAFGIVPCQKAKTIRWYGVGAVYGEGRSWKYKNLWKYKKGVIV